MRTYNEIKAAIDAINPKPIATEMRNFRYSDGLVQSHQHYTYGEDVQAIRDSIWGSNNLSMREKQELNEYLVSKMSI